MLHGVDSSVGMYGSNDLFVWEVSQFGLERMFVLVCYALFSFDFVS